MVQGENITAKLSTIIVGDRRTMVHLYAAVIACLAGTLFAIIMNGRAARAHPNPSLMASLAALFMTLFFTACVVTYYDTIAP